MYAMDTRAHFTRLCSLKGREGERGNFIMFDLPQGIQEGTQHQESVFAHGDARVSERMTFNEQFAFVFFRY